MLVFLTGFMAAGKSSVGRLLSERLQARYLDLDEEIEAQAGMSIAEIFSRRGEAAFRQLESEVLMTATRLSHAVVATGGGVVIHEANVRAMRSAGKVVWLDSPFETMAARLTAFETKKRPLFKSGDAARKIYSSRLAAYENCDWRIDIGPEESPEAVAGRILRWLEDECGT